MSNKMVPLLADLEQLLEDMVTGNGSHLAVVRNYAIRLREIIRAAGEGERTAPPKE
jgi:hypothetical protein